MLDDAGIKLGADGVRFTVRLSFDTGRPEYAPWAQAIRCYWGAIGFKAVLDGAERPVVLKDVHSDYDFDVSLQNHTTSGDSALGVSRLYTSESIKQGAAFNSASGYSNPEVDDLFAKGRDAATEAKRGKAYSSTSARPPDVEHPSVGSDRRSDGEAARPVAGRQLPMVGRGMASTVDVTTPDAGPTLTEALARYWSKVRYEDLPPEAVALAKRFLIDNLAAAIAGADSEVAGIAFAAAQAMAETASGRSVVWGRRDTLPAGLAAMVNGTASHALELDDFGGCGHSGAVVIPVVSSMAALGSGVSGKEAIVATLAGYDLAARTLEGAGGYRRHNDLGWHSTGTCGSFGAAAAAARLLKLNAERFADALGIAGTFTGGIWAFLADGAMTKRFHPGRAAENGLSAALLAEAGMTGPRRVLEVEWGGFYSTYAPGIAHPEATLAGLGSEFRISTSGMKPYACCRGLHVCLDSLFHMMRLAKAEAADIAGMTVHGNAQVCRQFDRRAIGNMLDAQFSMQYALACGALSGRGTLDQFRPLRHEEPQVKRLMGLIEVVDDRTLAIGEYPPLELRLKDGRRFEHQTPFAKGAPENPLTDKELEDKVVSLVTPVFGVARCHALMACVASLESLPNLRELTRLLVPEDEVRGAA